MTEATQTGAEINTPAPGSVDEAAQKINGLFGEIHEEEKEPEGETSEEVLEEVTEESETEPESEESEESETEAEEEESRPLTTLSEIAESLGVSESDLYDIKLKTKIDGQDGEATLAQLVKSYQLEGHLNRKSMEVSDLKKEIEKERESIEQHKQQKLSELNQAGEIARQLLLGEYQSIDWDKLKKEDSIGYLEKKAQFEEYQQSLNQIYGLIQQENQKVQQQQQEKLKKYIEDQQTKLRNAVPEWKDEKVLKAQYSELINFLRDDIGVTKDELNTILDHRFYLLARDAKRYRDIQKKNPRVENKDRSAKKVVKAGTQKGQERSVAQIGELKTRFKKSKDVNSAAALINALASKQR